MSGWAASARPLGAFPGRRPASALLSSCGTAPYAATVNGDPISVQELAAQAHDWASSQAFVKYQDAQFLSEEEAAASEGQSNVPNNTVEGNGSGPNVYGMYWTTIQLSNMITSSALRQYLAKQRRSPSGQQYSAAWSSEWANNPTIWSEVGQSARTSGASYDSERAQLVPATDAKTDEQFYAAHKADFWTSVCLLEDDVSVVGSNGTVDMAASKAQAQKVESELAANPTSPPASVSGGSRYCENQEQFIEEPAAFTSMVNSLPPGHPSSLQESWGYKVLVVTSRAVIPYSAAIASDIEVVTSYGGAQGQPNSETKVIDVLKGAKVKVNPEYGEWSTNLPSPYPPEVLPPGSSS